MLLENYRHYLQKEFENRRIRNSQYSLRAYARDLKVSPSRLSEAMNGKRGISAEWAQKATLCLGLDGVDVEIFMLSVEAEHSRSPARKKSAQEKLRQTLDDGDAAPKVFTMTSWVTAALLKLNERESVIENIDRLALKLEIPKFMVTGSLRFLTRLGLIASGKGFKTYLEGRGKNRRLNIDYTQILEQAQKAYSWGRKGSDFQHQAYLLEPKDFEKASRILRRALSEIQQLESTSKSAKLVFVANQIFSLEKEGKRND